MTDFSFCDFGRLSPASNQPSKKKTGRQAKTDWTILLEGPLFKNCFALFYFRDIQKLERRLKALTQKVHVFGYSFSSPNLYKSWSLFLKE